MQRHRPAVMHVLLALALVGPSYAARTKLLSHSHSHNRANPIRKVISMLQMMEQKIREESTKREDLFDKYMCYCKSGSENLQKSIAAAEDRIPQLESSVKEAKAMKQQLAEDLKQHKFDRAEAKAALGESMSLDESEQKALNSEAGQLKSNVKSLGKAIRAVQMGISGSFLQTKEAADLRQLTVSTDMSGAERDLLSAFLVGGNGGHASDPKATAEVLGILKQMYVAMGGDLEKLHAEGEQTHADREALMAAKQKEIDASTKAIEDKTRREGELAVHIVQLSNDLEDTRKGMEEDQKFAVDLSRSCEAKKAEWEAYRKTQASEMVAIAETIKLLNDDDALDLFRKTLPTAPTSFLQIDESSGETRQGALDALRDSPRGDPRLDLLELAVRGQKEGFDKLIAKIDELAGLLREEQKGDDNKKAFCLSEIDRTEDETKAAGRSASDTETVIADTEDQIEEVKRNIDALAQGIKELDEQVAEATTTRKAEHAESVDTLAANSAAKSLLEMAKNRLHKFYNNKLHKKPAGEKRPAEDGAETGNMALVQDPSIALANRIGEAPESDLNYVKKTAESGGVLSMVELLRSDLVKKITELEMEEKHSQEDYENFVKDSRDKRAMDSKAISDKEAAKAELEGTMLELKEGLESHEANVATLKKELESLHADCDWLLQNFDLRRQARADEADALQKAKAVLSGADYSL